MKRLVKKIGITILSMALIVSLSTTVFAANDPVGTAIPRNRPLHILSEMDNRNECLNAFTSSGIVSGTYVTTFQDKTAYDSSHAFRYTTNVNTGWLSLVCDLNPSYYVGRSSQGYAMFQSRGTQTITYDSTFSYAVSTFHFQFQSAPTSTTYYCLERSGQSTGYPRSYYCTFSNHNDYISQEWYVLTF